MKLEIVQKLLEAQSLDNLSKSSDEEISNEIQDKLEPKQIGLNELQIDYNSEKKTNRSLF